MAGAPRVAALDGVRGAAIAGVVAFHAGALPGGFLGVDLFFVLSGFLITGILLHEYDSRGAVALTEFWTRRARRLVPAVLVLVAAAQLWARTRALPEALEVLNGQSVSAMLYLSNWYNVLFHVGYWSTGPARSPLNHLWSLAVEEQFYLVFPLVLGLCLVRLRMRRRVFGVTTAALALLSFALAPWLYGVAGANRAYFGTDTRAGAILLGATFAVWTSTRATGGTAPNGGASGLALPTQFASQRRLQLAGLAAVLVLAWLWIVSSTSAAPLYRGGLVLHAVASTVLIASLLLDSGGMLARAFRWRPLVWLGERSYSLYLWHWPVMVVMTPVATGLGGAALVVATGAVIMLATVASYEFVEHPIRYAALRGRRLVTSFALPAVCIVASALLFQPAPPPQFGTETLFTEGHGGLRVLIVGDSWARNLGVALAAADSAGRTTILNMGKGGCGIADAQRERSLEKGDFNVSWDCLTWHTTWPAVVTSARPDAAILMVGNWDQVLQDFDGTGVLSGPCDAPFQKRYGRQLDRAIQVLGARGARVFVANVRDNDARAGSTPDCMNQLVQSVVARQSSARVRLLDIYGQLCTNHVCPSTVNGVPVYDATGHLAPAAQRRIATWVLNTLYGSLAGDSTTRTPPR